MKQFNKSLLFFQRILPLPDAGQHLGDNGMAFKAKYVIYVLCHLVLILTGFVFVSLAQASSLWFAIGGSLIAAGFSGWVILGYMVVSDSLLDRVRILSEFGFVGGFDARSVRIRKEYEDRVRRAR